MRWSAVEKCTGDTRNLPVTCNDNDVTDELRNTTMASRPLKKAKYAWQVKGRGKNGLSSPCTFGDNHRCANSGSSDIHSTEITEEMNIEESHLDELHDASSNCDSATVSGPRSIPGPSSSYIPTEAHAESVDNDFSASSSLCHQNSAGTSHQSLPNPECVTSVAFPLNSSTGQEPGGQINYALRRWQSKQLAQGIIDNAINKVLGDLGIPSHQHDIINPNFNEPVNWGSYLNAQNIENEGVAEAIRQQGLQRKRFVQQPSVIRATVNNNILTDDSNATFRHCVSSSTDVPNSALVKTTDMVDGISDSFNQGRNLSSENEPASFAYKAGLLTQNNKYQTSAESSHLLNDVESLLQPDDLLNTAVSCAISEKGLGVLNVNE